MSTPVFRGDASFHEHGPLIDNLVARFVQSPGPFSACASAPLLLGVRPSSPPPPLNSPFNHPSTTAQLPVPIAQLTLKLSLLAQSKNLANTYQKINSKKRSSTFASRV